MAVERLGILNNRFRCVRCRGLYATQAKLEAHGEACNIAHGTTGLLATGTLLALIERHGVAAVADAADRLRATLATKSSPKAAVARAAGR